MLLQDPSPALGRLLLDYIVAFASSPVVVLLFTSHAPKKNEKKNERETTYHMDSISIFLKYHKAHENDMFLRKIL